MNDIPNWLIMTWLVLSSIFFILNIGIFVALLFMMVKMMKLVQDLTPRVHSIAERVDGIAAQVEDIAKNTKTTMEGITGRTKSVMGSVDTIAVTASRQFEKFSPVILGATAAFRVWQSVKGKKRPTLKN
jgi:hypothetical protein